MKKIFTLIATAFVALSVNAQKITFNFSNFEDATYEEAVTVNGLKINAASGKAIGIDANEKTVEDVKYTKRLKFGGTGGVTSRNIAFDVTSAGTLKIILISSSSGASDRSVGIAVNDTEVKEIAAPTTVGVETADITAPGEIKIYSKKSGVNLYLVEFEAAAPTGVETWDATKLTFDPDTKVLQQAVKTPSTAPAYKIPESANVFPSGTYNSILETGNFSTLTDWLAAQSDASVYAVTMNDYTFTAATASVSIKGVSTPNTDASDAEAWQTNAEVQHFELNIDGCPDNMKWTNYVKPKNGNPSLAYYDFYELKDDGSSTVFRVHENLWTVGCGQLPTKGTYYEITFAKAGQMVMGVYLNRPNSSYVVVVDKETITPLPASVMSFEGFCQNNTYKYPSGNAESDDPIFQKFNFRDDWTIDVSAQPSRALMGYLSFPVEAKTYLLFQPSSQVGLYGFQFTEADPANVEAITTKTQKNANAALYNLAGQKVDKSYKGIVIQNGRKFVNK